MSKDGIASLTLFFKIDRSTQKLTTGRIPSFDLPLEDSLFFPRMRPSKAEVSFLIKPADSGVADGIQDCAGHICYGV
jgi:hypothetical protein